MVEDDFEQAVQLQGGLLRTSLQEVRRAIVRLPSPVARISHGVAGLYQIPFVTEREGGGAEARQKWQPLVDLLASITTCL
jgi:hypothetical protein